VGNRDENHEESGEVHRDSAAGVCLWLKGKRFAFVDGPRALFVGRTGVGAWCRQPKGSLLSLEQSRLCGFQRVSQGVSLRAALCVRPRFSFSYPVREHTQVL
jgi:hypothetical protein